MFQLIEAEHRREQEESQGVRDVSDAVDSDMMV